MRRLLACAGLSLLLYIGLFALVLNRPLSLEPLRQELVQKSARLAALPSPKLVILAGSNGPFSHSCAVMGPMLNLPCENAGIAVGIGLDEIFARYAPSLHQGDVVYMPMELAQYTMTQAQYHSLADGAFLLRQDRSVLAALPTERILGAIFCCTLGDALEALAEMPLAHFQNPVARLALQYDMQGDRIDNLLPGADTALLSAPARTAPLASEIENGYGAALIARFVARERLKGVIIIGGWPVDFTDARISSATRAAVIKIYRLDFLNLPGASQYDRADFFNSEDHLTQPCQYLHSIAVAQGLGAMLGRNVNAPSLAAESLADQCPPS